MNNERATICLNMIVKNESNIIKETLTKLCNKIAFDYWVICDTGSTDNTPQIITEFFAEKEIKGELYVDEWVNFAHNRTLALQRAYKKSDLLLVFDADDEIIGDLKIPTQVLFDEYLLQLGDPNGMTWGRVLLINNHKQFKYLSVIHEYISCVEQPSVTTTIEGDYYIKCGVNGFRNSDPQKYLKDAQILANAYETALKETKAYETALKESDDLCRRYSFYCANSYRDYGNYEDAIKWYKITINNKTQWVQEKYISCLYIYDCYEKIGQKETGFYYLVKGLEYDTERLECLFALLAYYCREDMFKVAYNYYLISKEFIENRFLHTNVSNKLFVNNSVYNFLLPYYMIIIAHNMQDYKCAIKMFEIIFTKKHKIFEEFYIKHCLSNLQFFLKYIPPNDKLIQLANEYLVFLNKNGVNLHICDFLKSDAYIKAGIIMPL